MTTTARSANYLTFAATALRFRLCRLLFCCVLCAAFFKLSFAQEQKVILNHNVIRGSASAELRAMLDNVVVQRLLLDIALQPRSLDYINAALRDTGISIEKLDAYSLVHRRGNDYAIGLLLFTAEDMRRMRRITESYAQTLASALLARWEEIAVILKQYQLAGVDRRAVAFIVLGCFSLDWDGLALTAEKGYWQSEEKDGQTTRTVIWAWEPPDLSNKGLYSGSHSSDYGDATLVSFGDHYVQPRKALPDLLWLLPGRATQGESSDKLKEKVREVLEVSVEPVGERIGRIMLALRQGGKSLDDLARVARVSRNKAAPLVGMLVELGYIGQQGERYDARVPVLTQRDRALVKHIRRIGRDVMNQWLAAKHFPLQMELAELTPFRYGVPQADFFYYVWHYIFGAANRVLVEAGMFADPYAPACGGKGIIPVVFQNSLNKVN